jgi:uncharacterized 2Fe-2S/4Fe-4S cluster protein (DUF4445 family)
MNAEGVSIRLEPLSVEIAVPRGASLVSSLADHGVEFPCGGTGLCGGCGVRVLSGSLPVTEADRNTFTAAQLDQGWRLACQVRAERPLVLECRQWHMDVLADKGGLAGGGKCGLGIAIDLGTTTIAAQMIDMASGNVLAVETGLNPQAPFGSDVMSRIHAALHGADLTSVLRVALGQTIAKLAHGREQEIAEVILVGNTAMHHLFSGRSVEPLAHTPFASPHLGVQRFRPRELGWALPESCVVHFERCLGGFVGSDILAGIVATGMTHSDDLVALVDLGTNGEIAIGNRCGVVCASTAAGPAFEAGAIRMGMRAATGAISYVSFYDDAMRAAVIGDVEPRGICGSGLVDAVAVGLDRGAILASGRVANGTKLFPVHGRVVLYQSDIRELQLAKAAIAAGFKLVLKRLGARAVDLGSIYLAGAFGNYVRIESAIRIGLIEAPRELVHAAGNTALRGAKMLLLSAEDQPLPHIEHICLAADCGFQNEFSNCMAFPEVPSERPRLTTVGDER